MSVNMFDNGFVQIQFNTPPDRGNPDRLAKRQLMGFDSNSKRYVTIKNRKRLESRTLVFPHVPDALVEELRIFRLGTPGLFTWWDHAGLSHQIRFAASPLRHKPVNPFAQRCEIDVEGEV